MGGIEEFLIGQIRARRDRHLGESEHKEFSSQKSVRAQWGKAYMSSSPNTHHIFYAKQKGQLEAQKRFWKYSPIHLQFYVYLRCRCVQILDETYQIAK